MAHPSTSQITLGKRGASGCLTQDKEGHFRQGIGGEPCQCQDLKSQVPASREKNPHQSPLCSTNSPEKCFPIS